MRKRLGDSRSVEFLLDVALMLASTARKSAPAPASCAGGALRACAGRLGTMLVAEDSASAEAAWRAAFRAAARSRRWDALVAVGDAARRAGEGGWPGGRKRARRAYVAALLCAVQGRCLEGVGVVARGFADLGEVELTARAARIEAVLALRLSGDRIADVQRTRASR
jgi:hypothetical protein